MNERAPRTSRRTLRFLLVSFSVAVALYASLVFVAGQVPEWTSVERACTQPESLSYDTGSSYSVFVREPTATLALTGGPLNAMVSRSEDGNYGVAIDLNPSTTDARSVTCRWTSDQVEIIEPNGITHVVPVSVFTGGR